MSIVTIGTPIRQKTALEMLAEECDQHGIIADCTDSSAMSDAIHRTFPGLNGIFLPPIGSRGDIAWCALHHGFAGMTNACLALDLAVDVTNRRKMAYALQAVANVEDPNNVNAP